MVFLGGGTALGVVASIRALCAAGGLLVGFPENPPESLILHGPELQYYVQRFQKSGFR